MSRTSKTLEDKRTEKDAVSRKQFKQKLDAEEKVYEQNVQEAAANVQWPVAEAPQWLAAESRFVSAPTSNNGAIVFVGIGIFAALAIALSRRQPHISPKTESDDYGSC